MSFTDLRRAQCYLRCQIADFGGGQEILFIHLRGQARPGRAGKSLLRMAFHRIKSNSQSV